MMNESISQSTFSYRQCLSSVRVNGDGGGGGGGGRGLMVCGGSNRGFLLLLLLLLGGLVGNVLEEEGLQLLELL